MSAKLDHKNKVMIILPEDLKKLSKNIPEPLMAECVENVKRLEILKIRENIDFIDRVFERRFKKK